MTAGLLLFDPISSLATQGGDAGTAILVLEDSRDVLVFSSEATKSVVETPGSTDFLVVDSPVTAVEIVEAPSDFLLIDPPAAEPEILLDGSPVEDFYVVTSGGPPGPLGPAGPKGDEGLQGPTGPAGDGTFYEVYGFATASNKWTIVHNRSSLGLNVETVDLNGESIEGDVQFVDLNTIEIDWYYPMAGEARLFR